MISGLVTLSCFNSNKRKSTGHRGGDWDAAIGFAGCTNCNFPAQLPNPDLANHGFWQNRIMLNQDEAIRPKLSIVFQLKAGSPHPYGTQIALFHVTNSPSCT